MMNMINYKTIVLIFASFLMLNMGGCSVPSSNENVNNVYEIENFHKVDEKLYRSTQPSKKAFMVMHDYGIKSVVDLRQWHSDEDLIKDTGVKHYKFPLNASKVTYEDLVKIVATIESLHGKVLVHCLHGSDRTGVVVAAYRIYHGWDKKRAVEEFTKGGYGYHAFWFPNLKNLLLSLDEQRFRNDVNKAMKEL